MVPFSEGGASVGVMLWSFGEEDVEQVFSGRNLEGECNANRVRQFGRNCRWVVVLLVGL